MTATKRRKRKKYRKKVARKQKHRHESDLTNIEWDIIKLLLPERKGAGRKRSHSLRAVINGILYLLRTGCQWEYIPTYYPPWSVCRYYFDKWKHDDTLERINRALCEQIRVNEGRNPTPSATIIDSQSKKTTESGGEKGYDGGKKVDGRKRFILVDTIGNLLAVLVVAANTSDQRGGATLLDRTLPIFETIQKVWTDGGFQNLSNWISQDFQVDCEVIERPSGVKGFVLLPRRWVVERTLAWLCRNRRLTVDYEHDLVSSVGMVLFASIQRSVRRLAHPFELEK